ncbi:hypothetical protein Tco_1346779 [Tanacetum coccineum]
MVYMLSSFLISQDFSKGSVDPTLFIRKEGKELLLVQVYVDDIIFAASTPKLYPPMVEKPTLDDDKKGKPVEPSHYRVLIGTLLDLTASKPSLPIFLYAVCQPGIRLGLPKKPLTSCVDPAGSVQDTVVTHLVEAYHDIRFYFIKEHVENGVIELYFVNAEYQLADIFTKALARERIKFLINKLGMRSFTPE